MYCIGIVVWVVCHRLASTSTRQLSRSELEQR
jgi:hypothetical protein